MPHIHTKPGQHDHTASAYIIRTDTPKPTVMLHRHKILGKYLQFGGHIELDETPWQTILHEVEEEVGYLPDQLLLLQPKARIKNLIDAELHPYPVSYHTHPFSDTHKHIDIDFAFVASAPPKHAIASNESHDIRLFTKEELLALPTSQTYDNVKEIARFIFDECLKNWERIPAADWNKR